MNIVVRPLQPSDHDGWLPLWNGYNAFYGREGATALAPQITQTTWSRFFDPAEPVHALVAESSNAVSSASLGAPAIVGITHYLYHRSTTRIELTCYLQDLYTLESCRGSGVGRALIQGVYEQARLAGIKRVYWQTHQTNEAGRALYDKVAAHLGFIVYSHDV